eukprot:654120-Pelagomonas_calceolata.AAC.1
MSKCSMANSILQCTRLHSLGGVVLAAVRRTRGGREKRAVAMSECSMTRSRREGSEWERSRQTAHGVHLRAAQVCAPTSGTIHSFSNAPLSHLETCVQQRGRGARKGEMRVGGKEWCPYRTQFFAMNSSNYLLMKENEKKRDVEGSLMP